MSGQGLGGGGPRSRAGRVHTAPQSDIPPHVEKLRNCPRCGEEKPLSEYARDKSKAGGHKSHCKRCDNAKSRRYYAENGERVRARINALNAERRGL